MYGEASISFFFILHNYIYVFKVYSTVFEYLFAGHLTKFDMNRWANALDLLPKHTYKYLWNDCMQTICVPTFACNFMNYK